MMIFNYFISEGYFRHITSDTKNNFKRKDKMVMFNAGDTAWVLTCTLLVLIMSIPAVAFFYGGLSKRKNVLNTIFLTFIAFSTILFNVPFQPE